MLKSYDEMMTTERFAYKMGYEQARRDLERMEPDFPTDEDVEVAAQRICESRDGDQSSHPDRLVCSFSRFLADAALQAVADARRTEEGT